MMDFIMCIVQYALIAIALAGVAGLGLFAGKKLRDYFDAKKAAAATIEE